MSKKILKRSLALGALMAFVITGSAMAAEVNYADFISGKSNGDTISVVEDTTVNKDSNTKLLGYYTVDVNEGVDLVLNSVPRNTPGGPGLNVTGKGNVTINATDQSLGGWNINGIALNANISAKNLTVNATLETSSAKGIYSGYGGNIVVNAGNSVTVNSYYHGLHSESGGEGGNLTINTKDLTITTTSTGTACAIMNSGNCTTEINATGNVKFNTAYGIQNHYNNAGSIIIDAANVEAISTHRGVVNKGSGDVTIRATGDVTIKNTDVDNKGYMAVDFENRSDATGNIVIDAGRDTKIEGGISNNAKGDIVVGFKTEDSYLTGRVVTNSTGKTNLTFNGATWNVTGESNVSKIDGTGVNVKVSEIKENLVTIEEKGADTELTVTTSSDNFEGTAEEGMVALANVVTSNGEAAANKLVATAGSVYDVITAEVEGGEVTNINKTVAAANVSVNDMAAIGLMSWRAEMNDMNKRIGELRNANGEHGVWVRMVRGESEYNSVKNQYNQYQLGYDEKLSVDKRWTVGVALSYTDAENNFAQGAGESTNKALSIYGSKLNDDGTFIDLIAKYARLENDFTTYSGQGAGEYDANGYSFSAEFGKRIQQGNGLWIEPQVELTYGTVGSADYVTEKGVNVAQDSMDSIVGRIGFSLGKDIKDGNVYARASYLYDFDGETKAVLNGVETLEQDLGGGWWEVGVGANINLSKATYIYADIEKTFGGEVDTNWQWNLGVRYSF